MLLHPVVAGVDIGGTNTEIGLVDTDGHIHVHTSLPTTRYADAQAFVVAIGKVIHQLVRENPGLTLKGIGVGAPNGNFFSGNIQFAPNLPWKGILPIRTWMEAESGLPVVLTNDANAAALGEGIYGAARGLRDYLFITLGTGVGSGIVVNGALVYGHDGFAGEIGHVIMDPRGRNCGCGRRGCLETYCSAGGIVRTWQELSGSTESISSREISDRAAAGETVALETFRKTAEMLGLALANSVAYTAPEAIFLFGGPAGAGEILMAPLREAFESYLLNIWKEKIRILPSGLPMGDAAILGAASLVSRYLP